MMKKIYIAVGYKISPVLFEFTDKELIDFVECATDKKIDDTSHALTVFRDELAKDVVVFTPEQIKAHIQDNGEWKALLETN